MAGQGWIKLHRKFYEWKWYKNMTVKTLFLHLLLKANHTEGTFENEVILRGQVLTGRKKLAQDTGMSEQQVRTSLSKLFKTNEISTIKSTNKYTILSIVNYDTYQDSNSNGNQHPTQRATNEQPTGNQQVTTNKNNNNNKNEKEVVVGDSFLDDIEPDGQLIDVSKVTDTLIAQWDSFAKHKAIGHRNIVQIEVSRLMLSNGFDVVDISLGISNYHEALSCPNSQAHDFQMARWLSKNFMESYIDGKFDIKNYDKSNFEKPNEPKRTRGVR